MRLALTLELALANAFAFVPVSVSNAESSTVLAGDTTKRHGLAFVIGIRAIPAIGTLPGLDQREEHGRQHSFK